ncbi:MAG: alpha/beta fold hydrolase, partial [Clostridia bacterium]|nr:alpha/beta fold hydrolase [Clostridia bacterium]
KSYRFFKTKRGDLHTSMYKEDTAALIEYLCKKFKKDKIVVFGHSWGTVLGTWVAYHHPEHIAAYVGQGQVIDLVRNEEISYNFVMQEAMKAGDKKTIKAIKDHPPACLPQLYHRSRLSFCPPAYRQPRLLHTTPPPAFG